MNSFSFLFILSYVSYISCHSPCNSFKTCGECIGFPSERCVWCMEENIEERRCQPESFSISAASKSRKDWCKKEFIYNPKPDMNVTVNKVFSSSVQFRPQAIRIKARPGETVNFTMSYQPADGFPLDVYFLMDYSNTMHTHKEALEKNVESIYNALKALTKNVRLGLGSFIEKPALPYGKADNYAFKNNLNLTKDMNAFKKEIHKSQFGGNNDNPEATLDALMQVMACGKELGWREETRRIVLVATDDTYHSAGDGKAIGAINPNDMQCHLKNNVYDPQIALINDYPSVSQINKLATEKNFKIIFAALNKIKPVYEALANQILGAKYVELKKDSNIMQIITDAYLESVKTVEPNFKTPSFIKIIVDPNFETVTTVKSKDKSDTTINMSASIKSTMCPKSNSNPEYPIDIRPLGLKDTLRITLEINCQCECEINKAMPSAECSMLGIKQCGVCKCNENRSGDHCELNCSAAEATKTMSKCFQYDNSTKPCNDRGTCRCGICDCDEGFSGEYCQYDNNACPMIGGLLCAGRGTCRFGECQCVADWIGDACNCPASNKDCMGTFSSKECSGHGHCECGKCSCNNISGKSEKYLGTFCDVCDDCAYARCEELKGYAYCAYKKEKEVCDREFNLTALVEVHLLNVTEFDDPNSWSMATKCRTELDDGTFLVFKYFLYQSSRLLKIIIRNEVEQPPKANIWVAVGSAIAGILLIGILTAIIWKIAVSIYDKREYDKFCKEAQEQGFAVTENVLYEPPNLNFINPTFNNTDH